MMKKLLFLCTLFTVLSGCGGSSNSTSDPQKPTPTVNTAPTLTGNFTVNVKAREENITVLNLLDKERDEVTFSITNAPSWLTFTKDSEQVKLSIKPNFFDIDNHKFVLNVSDGKLTSSYDLLVNVSDNPSQWDYPQVTESELLGTWKNVSDSSTFTFGSNGKGMLEANSGIYDTRYAIADSVDISLFKYGCEELDCKQLNFYELNILAKTTNKLRVQLFETETKSKIFNLYKTHLNSDGLVHTIDAAVQDESFVPFSSFDFSGEQSRQALFRYFYGAQHLSSYGTIALTLNFNKDKQAPKVEKVENQNFSRRFLNKNTSQYEEVEVAISVNKVTVLGQSENVIYFEMNSQLNLVGGSSDIVIENYEGLADYLTPAVGISGFQTIETVNAPILEAGESYLTRAIGYTHELEKVNFNGGGTKLEIISDTLGTTTLKTADNQIRKDLTFNYQINDDKLSLSFEGNETTTHSFYRLRNGNLLMSQEMVNVDNEETSVSLYRFEKVNFVPVKADYLGAFKRVDAPFDIWMKISETRVQSSSYNPDPTDFEFNSSEFYRYEADSSITIIRDSRCSNELSFESCVARIALLGEVPRSFRNIKFLHKKDNLYLARYRTMFATNRSSTPIVLESIRGYRKEVAE